VTAPGTRSPRPTVAARAVLSAVAAIALALGPLASFGRAAQGLTMDAKVLLQGHTRAGSWMAIAVRLRNDGPPVVGELRLAATAGALAEYSLPVDVPTTADKTYVLHAQPPSFGRSMKIDLVSGGTSVASATAAYLVHDATQLVVGVIAERPQGLAPQLDLTTAPGGGAPVIVPLTLADLPDRVEGWAPIDRLVWQDVDSNGLTAQQLTALRGWLAAGGELVVVGGTAGIATLSGFPDDLLPFRPSATLDVDPHSLVSLLGPLPAGAADLPAMSGALAHGRALATSGDRAIAARLVYGTGVVTLLGFDPTAGWPASATGTVAMWRTLLPPRGAGGPTVSGDDSNLVRAVQQLPILAPPPIGGLLILLAAYIAVVGPLNYLVLKRLDRREWAWVTMPILVVGFAAAAYGYGSFLRGSDVVVNEVAIIRAAPDATEAQAQVYFGIYSPTRGSYLVQVPGGALLGPTISGQSFGSATTAAALDVVQSDQDGASAIRDLQVGFSSLRYVRAETPATAPRMRATLALAGNLVTGTFENASDQPLQNVAVVLGGSVAVLGEVAAHKTVPVRLTLVSNAFGAALPDQVIGPQFSPTGGDKLIRYTMLQQLTYDPTAGFNSTLDADGPVVLAFTNEDVLGVKVQGQEPRRTSNAMYYLPVPLAVTGKVTFEADLIHQVILSSDAMFFGKGGPTMISMGAGTVTVAYRPIAFEGTFAVSALRFALSSGNVLVPAAGKEIAALPSIPPTCTDSANTVPPGCVAKRDDFLPDIEMLDVTAGAWVRLPRIAGDASYSLADAARYVDPASGQVLVRFVNDNPDASLNFGLALSITGEVR
jgi:hypothetical protein